MANCPKCGSSLSLAVNNETKKPTYVRCSKQKTEKNGASFNEVGECDFKIQFNTKMYSIDKNQMKELLSGKQVQIKDNNKLSLDLTSKYFTKIEFGEKYSEEAF